MYTADPTQPTLSIGTLDVGLASRYVAELLIGNQMTPEGDPTQARTETSRVVISGAVVTVTDAAGNELTAYTTATSQTVDPASGDQPSYAVLQVIAVDPGTVNSFSGLPNSKGLPAGDTPVTNNSQQQIVSNIQVFGKTLGGESVQSNTFAYPINLCLGCLVTGLQGQPPACATTSASSAATLPCYSGQDQVEDCSLCDTDPVCVCDELTCNGSTPEMIPDAGGGG
jgi:hypothetical protein